jgi:Fe2+ transport system protein FeoA
MRLMSLGLRVGAEVTVTHARGGGVVVASEAGRVAIGPELARHIRVEEIG